MQFVPRFSWPALCAFALLAALTACQKPGMRGLLLRPAQLPDAKPPDPKIVLLSLIHI